MYDILGLEKMAISQIDSGIYGYISGPMSKDMEGWLHPQIL
jgi:hypothetical protein